MKDYAKIINDSVAKSFVGRRFRLEGSGHRYERKDSRFLTEVRAGLATFFAMAYIISVNSGILTDSGGPCECPAGMTSCDDDPGYNSCLAIIHRDFVTGTAAIAALTSVMMGLCANMPISLAPGMGLNAYFTYTVVGFHGSGPVSYNLALTAVFVEGLVFIGLSLLGLRQWLARSIPGSIKLASSVGIGLYLTIIGLGYSAGIGLITGARDTPVELAGCVASAMVDGICPNSTKMRSPTMWIGIFCGGMLTALLLMYRVKGAIIAGIALVAITSWPRNSAVTYFPHTPAGDEMFDFFKQVVTFHPIEKTLNVLHWNLKGATGQFGLAFITFLYVDIMDCTGTLYSMAHLAGAVDPVTQDFEGSAVAYMVDAFGITIGSLFGLSPVTAFIESGAGISEGGKTGITAIVSGICFFISIFFAPIFASIPPWATGCTLVIVGSMMCKAAAAINWRYPGDAIPAFVTLAVMPFTYSIAYGLIGGIITYAILNTTVWIIEKASGGRWVPSGKIHKEPWTYKLVGGVLPPWVVRAARGKRDFWHEDDEVVEMTTVRSTSSSAGKGENVLDATTPPDGEVLPEKDEAYRDAEAKTHGHAL